MTDSNKRKLYTLHRQRDKQTERDRQPDTQRVRRLIVIYHIFHSTVPQYLLE